VIIWKFAHLIFTVTVLPREFAFSHQRQTSSAIAMTPASNPSWVGQVLGKSRLRARRLSLAAIETKERLREVALGLIRSVFPPQRGIRLVGVSLSNFG
jgi:hypothetical protein